MNKCNFAIGDMIIYHYLKTEIIRGRILELKKDTAIIEIGICNKKSEEVVIEKSEVSYEFLYPMSYLGQLQKQKKLRGSNN